MHIVLLFLLSFYYNTSTIYCHITPHTHPQGCAGGVSLLIPPLALGEGEKLRKALERDVCKKALENWLYSYTRLYIPSHQHDDPNRAWKMALHMFPLLPWLQLEDAPLDSLPPVLLGPHLCLVVAKLRETMDVAEVAPGFAGSGGIEYWI